MSPRAVTDYSASVKQRLLNISRERKTDFNSLLSRYTAERLLYRLGKSEYSQRFILKGATLFTIWDGEPHRATKDLDFLSYGSPEISEVEKLFKAVCQESCEEDGVLFFPDSVQGERIKEDQDYEGVRVKILGKMGNAQINIQIDVGFGDAVTPAPKLVKFPTIFDLPSAELQAYPPETAVAEKFQAMVALDILNSRVKDFYDIWFLAQKFEFEGNILREAIEATFERRNTPLPSEEPLALTPEFFEDSQKQALWNSFIKRGKLKSNSESFSETASVLKAFLMPPCLAALNKTSFNTVWNLSEQRWVNVSS